MQNSTKHHRNKAVHANLLIPAILSIFFLFFVPIMNILPAPVARAATSALPPETNYAANNSGLSGDDVVGGPYNIGFSFTYYGNAYTQFQLTTNGLLCFSGGATNTWSNTSIPNSSAPNNCIYGFWDDLYGYSGQPLLYQTVGSAGSRKLIAQWTNYGYYGDTLPMGTFQIILYEGSNNIRTQYRQLLTETRSYGQSATIGVENSNGTVGMQFSYNTASLTPEQSILWTWNGSNNYNIDAGAAYDGVYLYIGTPPPGVPQLISPTDGAAGVSRRPTFSWNAASGATSYNLVVSPNSNLTSPIINITQTGTSYTIPDTSPQLGINTDYYWGVKAVNAYGNSWSSIWRFSTTAGNSTPTDISLSNNSIPAGQPTNTIVGTLSTSDPNAGDTFTYSLVSGAGSSNNSSFNISGTNLRTTGVLTAGSYSIRIRSTDQGGLYIDEIFTITVTAVNAAPTDITLSGTSIAENQPANTQVGTFATADPNAGDTFTYSLVSGSGSTDNASFNISGNSLRATSAFDYEARSSYSVRVRSTDQGGLYTEKAFTITVTDVVENTTTTIGSDSPDPSVFGQNYTVIVTVSPASSSGTPTGSVNVSDGTGNTCSIASLSSGSGSCSLSSTTPGVKTLTASYSGDVHWNSSSGTAAHTVNRASTLTTITSDAPDPSELGNSYTVNVSVAVVAPGSGTPTGSVSVSDGTNTCSITLSGGSGSCNLPSNTVSSLTITATYSGSTTHAGSSDTETHAITDTTAPTVTINQASAQADPTNTSPIEFTVTFSESVTGFAADDVVLTDSTAPGALVAAVSGSGSSYTVSVSGMTDSGLVIVSIPAAAAQDASGNTSEASTSTDNSVTYDVTSPTVTINQASAQADPTNTSPIEFTVTFSESVTGFAADDVVLTDSTAPGALVAAVSGSGSSYTVSVSGMTDSGIVTASIRINAVVDDSGNTSLASSSTDNDVLYDVTAIALMQTGYQGFPGNTKMKDLGVYTTRFKQLLVTFDSDAYNPTGDSEPDDVTNPANYLLLKPGPNQKFETTSCTIPQPGENTPVVDDVIVPIGPVEYDNHQDMGPFEAILTVNNGTPLPYGKYRLIVCGSTSITDLAGNPLNGGTDPYITFSLSPTPDEIPATGFPVGEVTSLPIQPVEKAYANTGMTLRVPTLGLSMDIVGVPLTNSGWDISWLSNEAGYLEGSAFPTWAGNTVLTGHVWDANNLPGPFNHLRNLKYGDLIEIEAWGLVYTYEVRSNSLIGASNVNTVMRSEVLDWLTLVTCESYNAQNQNYPYRRMVRAVLISVK